MGNNDQLNKGAIYMINDKENIKHHQKICDRSFKQRGI